MEKLHFLLRAILFPFRFLYLLVFQMRVEKRRRVYLARQAAQSPQPQAESGQS